METEVHIALKAAARAFLLERGARAVACEVRCPMGRRALDVAAYFPRSPRHTEAESAQAGLFTGAEAGLRARDASRDASNPWTAEQLRARTVVVECKATREDFQRDGAAHDALLREREAILARRESIERSLRERGVGAPSEPMLFGELAPWDFSSVDSPARTRVMTELSMVERKLRGQTKFFELARYRLADVLLVAAPRGLLRVRDIPEGWGLAECPSSALRAWSKIASKGEAAPAPPAPPLTVRVRPPALDATPLWRERLLRHIAYALTREAGASQGAVGSPRLRDGHAPARAEGDA